VVGPWRVQLKAAVGAASVVVGLVLGQDRPQVPLAEDDILSGQSSCVSVLDCEITGSCNSLYACSPR
jgi:hypothetical protein